MRPTSASAPSDAPAPRSSATKVPAVASRRAPMVRLFVGLFRRAPDGDLRLSARNHLGKPAFPAAPSCLGVAAVFVSSSPSCRKRGRGTPASRPGVFHLRGRATAATATMWFLSKVSHPASRRHHGLSVSRSARPRHSSRPRLRSFNARRSSLWLVLTSPRSC